jgi:hypothetical protein
MPPVLRDGLGAWIRPREQSAINGLGDPDAITPGM